MYVNYTGFPEEVENIASGQVLPSSLHSCRKYLVPAMVTRETKLSRGSWAFLLTGLKPHSRMAEKSSSKTGLILSPL